MLSIKEMPTERAIEKLKYTIINGQLFILDSDI
jgi:hypothetical protein